MDNNSPHITDDIKNKVYDLLADEMINALHHGSISSMSVKDSEESAEYIATNLPLVKTKTELMAFLKELAHRWYEYESVYLEFQKEDLMEKVKADLHKLSGEAVIPEDKTD